MAGAQTARASRSAAYVFSVGKHARLCGIPIRKQKAAEWRLFVLAGAQTARAAHGAAMCFPWENTLAFVNPHTKVKDHRMVVFYFGRGTKARTLDTRFWRPLLYQLSYTPIGAGLIPRCALAANQAMLERVTGIEPARPAWKAGILPLNYTRRINA